MKKYLLIVLVISPTVLYPQTRLATWTFDGLATAPNTPTSILPISNGDVQSLTATLYADGTNGSSSWKTSSSGNELTSQAGTTLNDPRTPPVAGNALTLANSSANGKSVVFKFSMLDLRDPMLSFTIRSTATGFNNHTWSWSTDGATFTVLNSYPTVQTSTFYLQTLNLASINELDGAPSVYLKLTIAGATASNGNNRIDNISISATTPIPPAFAANYPQVRSITRDSFVAAAGMTTPGNVYFVLLSVDAPAPSATQVKAQQDGIGNAALRSGKIVCATANLEFIADLQLLLPSTAYKMYWVAENGDGMLPLPEVSDVTTLPDGDHSPPEFNSGYPVVQTFNSAIIVKVRLNEPARVFAVAVPAGAAPPSIAQVIQGHNGENESTPMGWVTTTVGAEYPMAFATLTSAAEYDIYVVARDTAANLSALSKLTVTSPPHNTGTNEIVVATYNLDFFASDARDEGGHEFGPDDDALQTANISAVLGAMAADIFGVEEISNEDALRGIIANLPDYDLIVSDRWSHSWQSPDPHFPPQKIGFIYNRSTMHLVDHEVLFADLYDAIQEGNTSLPDYPGGNASDFWSSGRLPLTAQFDVLRNGITQRLRFVLLHAKSGSAPDDYNRRAYDANYLFRFLASNYANEKIIILGDFNDLVERSINPGSVSPYRDFVDDTNNYHVLTYGLSESGLATFPALNSFIDHIIVSSELNGAYVTGSSTVEHPDAFIHNYLTTTSDHFPVVTRLTIKRDQSITFPELPVTTYGDSPVVLKAVSSSAQEVSYSITDASVATVENNKLIILAAGSTDVIASQAGNDAFYPAAEVRRKWIVNKATQAITWAPIEDKTFGDNPFDVSVTASSALPVSIVSKSTNVTLSDRRVTIVKPGRVSMEAIQPGNNNYLATTATVEFCVNPAKPVITMDLSGPVVFSSSAVSGNQWYRNGDEIKDATNTSLVVTQTGNYKVRSSTDDCLSAFSNEVPFSIASVNDGVGNWQVYPNPAGDYIEVAGLNTLSIDAVATDMFGRTTAIYFEKKGNVWIAAVGGLSSGLYLLTIPGAGTIRLAKK